MKRFWGALLIFCLVCCLFPMSVYAESNVYFLDELGMSIDFPEEWIVFTRDLRDDDPNLSKYGLTKEGLRSSMLEQGVYLDACDENFNYEIVITMVDTVLSDYNLLGDMVLESLKPTMVSKYESMGITPINFELYHHAQTIFIKSYISQQDNGDTVYGLQYNTVYDGKGINITLQSYAGEIDSNMETSFAEIIDTVKFDAEPQFLEPPTPTEPFTYTDKNSGLSFTVPANWVESPMSEEREFLSAKFISNFDGVTSILFASYDLWDALTDAEKTQYSKDEVDNSILTRSDIAEMYECNESDVSMVTLSDREYFCAEIETTETSQGFTLSIPMTYLIRCENGYCYLFQFSGGRDSEYYSDFQSLVASAEYPQLRSETADLWQPLSATNLVASLIITILIYSFPILIYRYVVIKRPVDKKKAKRITIIYGIIAFIVMSLVLMLINGSGAAGGAIFLWSWVNYRMLIGGMSTQPASSNSERPLIVDLLNTPEPDIILETGNTPTAESMDDHANTQPVVSAKTDSPDEESNLTECNQDSIQNNEVTDIPPEVVFCHKCGHKLLPHSLFCSKCGTKIPNISE